MNPSISKILEQDEKVMWSAKPDVKSLLFYGLVCSLLLFSFSTICFLYLNTIQTKIKSTLAIGLDGSNSFQIFLSIIVVLLFIIPIVMYRVYKTTDYVVTNNRFIIKKGIIRVKTRSVYYDEMHSAFVNKGLMDNLFATGTILIDANKIIKHNNKKYSETTYVRFRYINLEDYIDFIDEVERSYKKSLSFNN